MLFPPPVPIGDVALGAPDDCGENVDNVTESNNILTGTVEGFNALKAGVDCDQNPATLSCPGQPGLLDELDGGVCPHELGSLAAHTLALTYNTLFFPAFGSATFGNQTLSQVSGCIDDELIMNGRSLSDLGTTPSPLTLASTFFDVLERANLIINEAAFGNGDTLSPSVNPDMVETMKILLGRCVNQV